MSALRKIFLSIEHAYDRTRLNVKNRLNLFDPVIIYPYLGYSNGKAARIHGRVLEKERMIHGDQSLEDNIWNNFRKAWKRYESDEIPRVRIQGKFMGEKQVTTSGPDGFFTLEFTSPKKKAKDAIYIRHVASKKRRKELETMSANLEIPMLLMNKSDAAISHACKSGWIKN